MDYKAFISYSHAADGELAPWLQQALHKFAKPWYRLRALRLFRDKTSLALTPELWPTIEQALEVSEKFILLASPEAATSRWVQKEVDYWITNRSSKSFFIVLTEGNLQWDLDRNDFEWSKTNSLPPNLKSYFRDEPLYLDLRWVRTADHLSLREHRLQDAIADLAAALHGRPKDELVGADIREHRRTLRLAWGTGITLFLLAILFGIAAIYANWQRIEAERLARNSMSRALAAQSVTYLNTKPETSLLLAVEAIEATRAHDSMVLSPAEEALRSALVNLSGSMPLSKHGNRVESAEFSPDGKWIATASSDGTVKVQHSEPDQPETFVLEVSSEGAQRASFSPDGRRLLALGGGVAKVWEISAMSAGPMFESSPEDNVALASFVGSGDLLALVSQDGELHLVGLEGNSAKVSQQHTIEGSPETLATNLSGDALAIGSSQGQIYMLAPGVDEAKLETVYEMGLGTITALDFSENARWLFVGNLDGRAVLIDRDTVQPKEKVLSVRPEDVEGFQRPPGTDPFGDVNASVDRVAFDAAGRYVAAGIRDGTVRVWDLLDIVADPLEIRAHNDTILQITFGPNAQWLMTSGRDGYNRFFSMPDGREFFTLPHRHEVPVDVVELNPARTRLLTADRSGSVRLWWLEPDGQEPKEIPGLRNLPVATSVVFDARREQVVWATSEPYTFVMTRLLSGGDPTLLAKFDRTVEVAVSDDGRYLAASGTDPRIYFWDLNRTGAEPNVLVGHAPAVFSLAFSSDGKWLASGSGDQTARIWRVEGPTVNAETILPHGSAVGTLSFDQSGKLLATGDWSSTVRVWSVPDGTLVRKEKLGDSNNSVKKVLITPDGRWLVSCAGNTVWIHALDKGGEAHLLRGHSDLVTLLAVDEASQWLASGSWDGTVRLWTFANPELEEYVLGGHVTGISDIAFSPDGTRLATTEGNAEVLLWHVTSPEAPPVRLRTPEPVAAVAFGPESQKVFAITEKGGVMIWDLDVENLVDLGCRLAGRALSDEEWKQFLIDQPYRPRCLAE